MKTLSILAILGFISAPSFANDQAAAPAAADAHATTTESHAKTTEEVKADGSMTKKEEHKKTHKNKKH